ELFSAPRLIARDDEEPRKVTWPIVVKNPVELMAIELAAISIGELPASTLAFALKLSTPVVWNPPDSIRPAPLLRVKLCAEPPPTSRTMI
ncbi:MAG: hypothetical protein AB7U20_15160, partial [Planctomycetaceae bacterium]